jgi:hypothetical protein
MVPYASFPYADHVLRLLDTDPGTKIDPSSDVQFAVLVKAAHKLRELVQGMENLDEIKGYIIYKEEEVKEQKEGSIVEVSDIVKKYQGKIVQDFVPHFLLA